MKDPRPFKALSTLLTIVFLLSSAPLTELRADMDTHREYDCDPLSVTYDQTASWDNTTQAELSITNISEETVDGWTLEIVFPGDITLTNIWNALDISDETTGADTLIVTNETYNAQINPNDTITFGLTAEGSDSAPVAPVSVNLITEEEEEQEPIEIDEDQLIYAIFSGSTEEDLTISGWKTEITGDVYTGGSFVYQGSELDVNGYVRTVGTIQPSGWKTDMEGAQENIVPALMPDWSEELLQRADTIEEDDITVTGQTVTGDLIIVSEGNITLNADTISGDGRVVLYSVNGDITIEGTQAEINGILYAPNGRVSINAYEITVNGRIVADKFSYSGAILNVTAGEDDLDFLEETDPTAVPTIEPTITITLAPTTTDTPVPTITVTPTDVPIDEELDNDEDGIPDYLEIEIGTDPYDPDTDSDGLEDFLELVIGYDPKEPDTDGDGIVDGDEDLDDDGLTNLEEISLGTEIMSEDTDFDGLKDGEEVYIYGTDPLNYDSDGDGILDGDEVILGKDPSDDSDRDIRIEQTLEKDIDNEEDPVITSVEVTMELANLIDRSLEVKDMYDIDVYSTDVEGRLGSPISFECEEDFDTATVVIRYDETKLGETGEEDLGILWYDEDTGFYITQEQAVLDTANNTITLEMTHFSTYVLVNLNTWDNVEAIHYEAETREVNYDFYFAFELTANMTAEERSREYYVLESFVGNMREGDRVHIIYFSETWSSDMAIKNYSDSAAISEMMYFAELNLGSSICGNGQYGSYMQAFIAANRLSEVTRDVGNQKVLFILSSDTEIIHTQSNVNRMNQIIDDCGFDVNFVMLNRVQKSSWNFGWQYAAETGSNYYNSPQYISLANNFNSTRRVVSDWDIDNDRDGLPDLIETKGVMGSNKHIYYPDPEVSDSDSDGLSDLEELGVIYEIYMAESGGMISISLDGVVVASYQYGSIPADSQYHVLVKYYDTIEAGEKIVICVPSSDPDMPDSDQDYYLDSIDINPLSSDVVTIGLGGGSYNLYDSDSGYIHVAEVPESLWVNDHVPNSNGLFYGGDQNWFTNITIGNNGVNLLISETGCGLIATNDVAVYIENGSCELGWDNYRSQVIETNSSFIGTSTVCAFPIITLNNTYSISPCFIQDYFIRQGYDTDLVRVGTSEQQLLLQRIQYSIENDYPVILLSDAGSEDEDCMLDLYNISDDFSHLTYDSPYNSNPFSSTWKHTSYHYVTITGLYINYEMDSSVYLRVQSWGREFYVDYYSFYNDCHDGYNEGKVLFVS